MSKRPSLLRTVPGGVPYISKTSMAYFEVWLAASPCYKSTDHQSNFYSEARFNAALAGLNKLKDDDFQKYVVRKLKAWYKTFLPLLATPRLAAAAVLHLKRVLLLWVRETWGGG